MDIEPRRRVAAARHIVAYNHAMTGPLYGAIESGGTKFVCAIGARPTGLLDEIRIPTTLPQQTLPAVADYFEAAQRRFGPVAAFGIASFGPVDLRVGSPGFGQLLPTPKPGWSGADLPSLLRARFGKPVNIDTDVNAAALAEQRFGAGRDLDCLAYVTVGTGIGGGAVINGRSISGLMHPEMGHIAVRRHPADTAFPGTCPFHGDCLEGLASGPAITARWGRSLAELGSTHVSHEIIAHYLGQLAATIALLLSVQRVVFGGGVALDSNLLPRIRQAALDALKGYLPPLSSAAQMEAFIQPAALGTRAGVTGAMLLAGAGGSLATQFLR